MVIYILAEMLYLLLMPRNKVGEFFAHLPEGNLRYLFSGLYVLALLEKNLWFVTTKYILLRKMITWVIKTSDKSYINYNLIE